MGITRRKFTRLTTLGVGLMSSHMLLPYDPSYIFPNAESASTKLNVGIIGTGARGNWIAKVIQGIPNVSLVACCDIFPPHLEQGLSLAEPGATGYDDYRKLLENNNIDAVIVATPLFMHFPMVVEALKAGKHVYCEKTMTYSIEEAVQLRKKVIASDRIFQVGYQHRYNPLYQEIKFLIDKGYCGKITKISATWNRNGDWRRPLPEEKTEGITGYPDLEHLINWRMYHAYSGGLMAELCSHQLDIVNWMLDSKPEKVVGLGGIDYWKDGRETFDNVNTIFEYPEGVKASFSAITSNALLGYSIQFLGDKGSVMVQGEQGHRAKIFAENFEADEKIDGVSGATKVAWENNEGIPIRVQQPAMDDYLPTENAITHFAQCIEKKELPLTNVEVGYQAAVSVHLANRAMQQNTIEYWNSSNH
jgi:predicted dehydrogenase